MDINYLKDGKSVDDEEKLKWYMKIINWVCGIEDLNNAKKQPQLTAEEIYQIEKMKNSIYEDRQSKIIVNSTCFALITVSIFYWGFFS